MQQYDQSRVRPEAPISRLIHASELLAPECQAEHRALPIGAPSRNHPKKLLHIRD